MEREENGVSGHLSEIFEVGCFNHCSAGSWTRVVGVGGAMGGDVPRRGTLSEFISNVTCRVSVV